MTDTPTTSAFGNTEPEGLQELHATVTVPLARETVELHGIDALLAGLKRVMLEAQAIGADPATGVYQTYLEDGPEGRTIVRGDVRFPE
jgi:hypothetical protein